jgi:hypothetical protein
MAQAARRRVRWRRASTNACCRGQIVRVADALAKSWRRLQGQNQLPKVVSGVTFRDGIEVASDEKSAV